MQIGIVLGFLYAVTFPPHDKQISWNLTLDETLVLDVPIMPMAGTARPLTGW